MNNHIRQMLNRISTNDFNLIFFNIISKLYLMDALKPFKQFGDSFLMLWLGLSILNPIKYIIEITLPKISGKRIEYFYKF